MKAVKYIILLLIGTYTLSLAFPLRVQGAAPEMIAPDQMNLMPVPASVQIQTGPLPLSRSFNVGVKNYMDDRLHAGIARMDGGLGGRAVVARAHDPDADRDPAPLVLQS